MSKLEQIAVELFKLDDWFMGCESGGVESPRVILGITTETDGDDVLVVISFTYQEGLYRHRKLERKWNRSIGSQGVPLRATELMSFGWILESL